MSTQFQGTIQSWNSEKGFGFISGGREKIFCHVSNLCAHICPSRGTSVPIGTEVTFEKMSTPKGIQAKKVLCCECSKPEVWKMEFFGETVKGLKGSFRELRAHSSKKGFAMDGCPWTYEEIEEFNKDYNEAKKDQREFNIPFDGYVSQQYLEKFGPILSIEKIDAQFADMYELTFNFGKIKLYFHQIWKSFGFEFEHGPLVQDDSFFYMNFKEKNWGIEGKVDIANVYKGLKFRAQVLQNISQELREQIEAELRPHIPSHQEIIERILGINEIGLFEQLLKNLSIFRNPGENPYVKTKHGSVQQYYVSPDERREGYETIYYTEMVLFANDGKDQIRIDSNSKLQDIQDILQEQIRLTISKFEINMRKIFNSGFESLSKEDLIYPNSFSSKQEYLEDIKIFFEKYVEKYIDKLIEKFTEMND